MSCETLILFTRFPVAGRAKTRLIPRLGAEGAAQVQREMTEHILARLWPMRRRRGVKLEVRFEDGSGADLRRWLGNGFSFAPQGNGDLGARMLRAVAGAFAAGAQAVVLLGADCPELDATLVGRALEALKTHRLVFGPAEDGGYYLLGLREVIPALFEDIEWGTRNVLAVSVAKARQLNVEPFFLPELSDVDEPADLEVWEKARRVGRTVSIIIPTLNEAEHLTGTLQHAATSQAVEIIVADGGSSDDTLRIAASHGAKLVTAPVGRARQMNAGAAAAGGETLLFLHADTWLLMNYRDAVLAALRRPDVVGGAFALGIRDPFRGRRWVERGANIRSRVLRLPHGDQALFVRRWAFEALGGFPDLPIMEDYEFVRRLRRLGKLALLDPPVLTSGRRWLRLGPLRVTFINQLVILGYHWGVSPAKLAAFYRRQTLRPRLESATPGACPRIILDR